MCKWEEDKCQYVTKPCKNIVKVCPYGCYRKDTDGSPYKPCPDTRSIFAFRGSWDPNPKMDYLNYEDNKGSWKPQGMDTSLVCPPDSSHARYPYDLLCKPHRECVAKGFENSKEETQKTTNKMCEQFQYSNGECDTSSYSDSGTTPKELIYKPTGQPIKCEWKVNKEGQDYCPFDFVSTDQSDTVDFSTRKPINVWKTIYDDVSDCAELDPTSLDVMQDGSKKAKEKACTTKKRLSASKESSWENNVRYKIVNQNYQADNKLT